MGRERQRMCGSSRVVILLSIFFLTGTLTMGRTQERVQLTMYGTSTTTSQAPPQRKTSMATIAALLLRTHDCQTRPALSPRQHAQSGEWRAAVSFTR